MIPRYRAWMKSLKWMCDVTNISFDSKFVDICQQGDTERYTEMSVEFDEITLVQSTGLKDKNGKEIFEGDIVRMRNPRDRRQVGMFQVVRVANSPMLGLLDKKLTTEIFNLYEHMSNYYEVKGNIYENQELLEDKE